MDIKKRSRFKIIIFGTGRYWENRKKYITDICDIVCFLDNDANKCGHKINGITIERPDKVKDYYFDYVLIMCMAEKEIYKQLQTFDVDKAKIINYQRYRKICLTNYYILYGTNDKALYDTLVFSTTLGYNGGTLAAIYAVKALMSKGYKVLLCAEDCNDKLLNEILKDRLEIMLAPGLPYAINSKLKNIISGCEVVLINVLQMLPIACQLNGKKPVLWWIHEPQELYQPTLQQYPEYLGRQLYDQENIVAVSNIAQNNFNTMFFEAINQNMPYGIPDLYNGKNEVNGESEKVTFAIIGGVTERKAQDVFLEAIDLLSEKDKSCSQFYIIGSYGTDDYSTKICEEAGKYDNIIMTGNLTRSEMEEIYPQLDVVVCPSREETMSIVLTEAMMYKKACIGSDSTGMADYIEDGVNGFVCRTEDPIDLCEKMRYFIHHPESIQKMGVEGRKAYEEYFTMEKFSDRLCEMLKETIDRFNEDTK